MEDSTNKRPRHSGLDWQATALFLLTVLGVLVCGYFVQTLLFSVTGAVTLAIVSRRPFQWLCRRYSRSICASLMLVAITVALVVPGFFVVKTVVHEARGAVRAVHDGEADDALAHFTVKHPKVGGLAQQGLDELAPEESGKRAAGWLALEIARSLPHLIRGITEVVLMLFFLFFLLRDEELAVKALYAVIPLRRGETEMVLERLKEVTHAIFAGRFVIAGVQGALAGVAYMVCGVPNPLLWGLLTAILCVVPAFGALLVWGPIVVYVGMSDSWIKAALLAIWCGVVVSTIDNFLYPMLVGQRTQLHTAVIFLSIFGGVALFGVSGFVLGPVIVTATILLLEVWKERLHGAEEHLPGL